MWSRNLIVNNHTIHYNNCFKGYCQAKAFIREVKPITNEIVLGCEETLPPIFQFVQLGIANLLRKIYGLS